VQGRLLTAVMWVAAATYDALTAAAAAGWLSYKRAPVVSGAHCSAVTVAVTAANRVSATGYCTVLYISILTTRRPSPLLATL